MPSSRALLAELEKQKRSVAAQAKRLLRRQTDALFPSRETRQYRSWIAQRKIARRNLYTSAASPGLFSILTPVWNGSPVAYLNKLAHSIAEQNQNGASEWVLLDNGCSDPKLLMALRKLGAAPWVKLIRADSNVGIIRGLRLCLENASGRYVLPVDGDDLLYSDALNVIASMIVSEGYPALLYTDEDKVAGSAVYQPYLKPDWDPVLLLNSAYIAHLGAIERKKALEVGAYSDAATEGSPDWDLFVRFLIAGYRAVHIPEVVYSWRVYAHSTADDTASKPYVDSSQKNVLQRYLDAHPLGNRFSVERSPLFAGGAHWHFVRSGRMDKVFATVVLHEPIRPAEEIPGADQTVHLSWSGNPRELRELAAATADQDGFICFIGADVKIEIPEWRREAVGIFELHPDTAMIGGRIRNRRGFITEAGLEFGLDGSCVSPNHGRAATDPGYFGQLWKQRSVSAVSTQLAVIEARFLADLLKDLPRGATLAFLGASAGAYARKTGRRIVYSPFLSGISDVDWSGIVSDVEKKMFLGVTQRY